MKDFMKILTFCCALMVVSMTVQNFAISWPGSAIDTTDLDESTDSLNAARADLYDMAQKVNDIIDDRNVANGVPSLDANTRLTESQAPRFAAGSAVSPSITFSSDSDTGVYSVGANILGFSAAGGNKARIDATNFYSPTTGSFILRALGGTNSLPTFSFQGDSNTGIYNNAADTIGFATAGTLWLDIDSDGSFKSTKSCASSFVRTAPNYCSRTTGIGYVNISEGVCTAVGAGNLTGEDEPTAFVLNVILQVASGGGVASRFTRFEAHDDAACSGTEVDRALAQVYEFSSVTAGTIIATQESHLICPVVSAGNCYIDWVDSGTAGDAEYRIIGYFD